MSLWTKFESLFFGGVDLEVEQKRQNDLNATIAAQDKAALDSGKWTPDQYNAAMGNLANSNTPDMQAAINAAFAQGAKEGLQNDINLLSKAGAAVSDATNKTLWAVLKNVFKAIPWPIWIIGAVVLFVYLGGLGIIRQQIKNAS